ncbi:MAG: LCP family protein [Clostridia bacterium]|nr:LCP family protein [Clostridia bacterium]
MKKRLFKALALVLVIGLLPIFGLAESEDGYGDWVNFLLICNEGMNNDRGNAGNTLMVVAMKPDTGKIRLLMFTWDTFIDYEGYDVPQKLDMPYRNGGAEEAMKIFNDNFDTGISHYMSLNYLNLASLIDNYGGVTVDISRAERNALNGMVGSKKEKLQTEASSGTMSQIILDLLANEYYLTEYGPETHLNGLQAVGFGWLQYDSVYNCCEREIEVIANLFHSVSVDAGNKVAFYTNESGEPTDMDGRRAINIDEPTEDDLKFLRNEINPIFQMSFNNLSDDEINGISLALARIAYKASRQGVNIFDSLETKVLPLEALNEYDIVAGTQGHLIDKDANRQEIVSFLYAED